MAQIKNFGLVGVGSDVQFGKAGPRLKNEGGVFAFRDAADAFTDVRARDLTADALKTGVGKLVTVNSAGQLILGAIISELATDLEVGTAVLGERTRAEAVELDLTTRLAAEVANRTSADSLIRTDFSAADAAEVIARNLAIGVETTRAVAEELRITGLISTAGNAFVAADEAVTAAFRAADAAQAQALSAESTQRQAADVALGQRIDNVLSNVDASALDSLTEVVAAFRAADSTINGAITSLANEASAARSQLAAEVRAADLVLTNNLAAEIARATAAEGVLTSNLSSEVATARAAELVLTQGLSSEVSRAIAAELAISTSLAGEVSRATAAELAIAANLVALTSGLSAGGMVFAGPSGTLLTDSGVSYNATTDTLTVVGNVIAATPTLAAHVTTKGYVDAFVAAALNAVVGAGQVAKGFHVAFQSGTTTIPAFAGMVTRIKVKVSVTGTSVAVGSLVTADLVDAGTTGIYLIECADSNTAAMSIVSDGASGVVIVEYLPTAL